MSEVEQEEERWGIHPVCTNYKVSSFGRVFNTKTKKFLKGHKDVYGYIQLNLQNNLCRKNICLHIVVYETFNGIVDSQNYDIHHKNSNNTIHDYNYLRNLEKLTRAEHMLITHGGKRSNRYPQSDKAIIRIKIEDGKEIERTRFNTMAELSKQGFNPQSIKKCYKGQIKTHKGYIFESEEFQDYTNEIWVTLKDEKFKGCQVSSFGRINYKGQITYGSKRPNGYLVKTINGKRYAVHYLVTYGFYGKPLSSKHTAHHKNYIKDDNRIENLEWRNKQEQVIDRKDSKLVQAFDKITGKHFKTWNTTLDAAKELNISPSNIGTACKKKIKTLKGLIWQYIDKNQQHQQYIEVPNNLKNNGTSIQIQAYYDQAKQQMFKQFDSLKSAAREFKKSHITNIHKACLNENKKTYGFFWKYNNESHKNKTNYTRKVQAFDCETQQLINEWDNTSQAAIELNIKKKNINQACNGKLKSCSGFLWKCIYIEKEKEKQNTSKKSFGRKVQAFDPTTKQLFKQFGSLQDAKRQLKLNANSVKTISKACQNQNKIVYGYYWSYIDQDDVQDKKSYTNRKIKAFDRNTNQLVNSWDSMTQAAKDLNVKDVSGIGNACNKRIKTYKGYLWEFSE